MESLSPWADDLASWHLVDVWGRVLQREVGATVLGTWLGNDDTLCPPPPKVGSLLGPASAGGEVLVRDRKSELLFTGCLSKGTITGLWPLALGSSVCGS